MLFGCLGLGPNGQLEGNQRAAARNRNLSESLDVNASANSSANCNSEPSGIIPLCEAVPHELRISQFQQAVRYECKTQQFASNRFVFPMRPASIYGRPQSLVDQRES